jgi:hypothetical protein
MSAARRSRSDRSFQFGDAQAAEMELRCDDDRSFRSGDVLLELFPRRRRLLLCPPPSMSPPPTPRLSTAAPRRNPWARGRQRPEIDSVGEPVSAGDVVIVALSLLLSKPNFEGGDAAPCWRQSNVPIIQNVEVILVSIRVP